MNNREKYRNLCNQEEQICVFSQPWWLDAVCGKNFWNVALIENKGRIIASLPYYYHRRIGLKYITMPQMTQVLGPWYRDIPNSENARLSYEYKIFNALYSQLPKVDFFSQGFHYKLTNWLPFYWLGFKQTTYYTYMINDISDVKLTINNFSYAKRKNIKKAESLLKVYYDLGCKEFYENHKISLRKQGLDISYTFKFFKSIYYAAYKNKSGRTIYAKDKNNNIHSALFLIWSKEGAYNLISTIDPKFRNSGSTSLLIKEVIKKLSTKTNRFDFEGSMIKGVESSFRQFGTIQTPYHYITKMSPRMNVIYGLKNFLLRR